MPSSKIFVTVSNCTPSVLYWYDRIPAPSCIIDKLTSLTHSQESGISNGISSVISMVLLPICS